VAAWNVLATSFEGRRDTLLVALRGLGAFRRGGYRNVIVGRVEDPQAFLGTVREALESNALLRASLAKLVPIETTVRITAEDAVDVLSAAAEPFLDRLAGGSFIVRLERRGLKGRLDTAVAERAIGERVWRALEARGRPPRVEFRDPDAILVIETLGDEAGLAVLPRALRRDFPFIRVR
jgi:tRNA(Ser,Leu) C12 N-acetylase TAN1